MPDPTRVEGPGDAAGRSESTTAEAPVRWSGAAPVPSTPAKKSRRSRLRRPDEEEDDWGTTPAVDPWADQDTPWALLPPPAPPATMPPTRIDAPALPPTRIDSPAPPPTRVEAPAPPPTRVDAPANPPTRIDGPPAPPVPGAAPAAAPVPLPAAAPAGPPKRAGWGWRKQKAAPPANRLPVQPRPAQPTAARPPAYPPPPPQWQPTTTRPPAAPPRKGPPAPPPRKGQPPANRPPTGMPPPRRRRRGRKLLTFALITGVLCCGVPAYFAWPAAHQYPVTADLPAQVKDLSLRDDSTSQRALDKLTRQLQDSNLAGQRVFGGVYADGNGKRVTVFGTTGLRVTPKQDVEAELSHLTGTYDIGDVESFDLGETGAHERCGVGRAGGSAVVICAWADHGSLATVLLTRRNVSESAQLVADLRSEVLSRS